MSFALRLSLLISCLCLCRVVAIKNYYPAIRIIIQLLQYQNKVWVLFVFVSDVAGLAKHNMIVGLTHKLTNRRQHVICYDLMFQDFFIPVIIYFLIYFFLLEGFGQWLGVVFPTARVSHPLMVSHSPIIRDGISITAKLLGLRKPPCHGP